MEINLFEEFMTITEQGSIRKAASLLKTSPAALSQRMTILEKTIGTTLFLRTNQRTVLTEAGQQFASDVAQFLTQYHKSIARVTTNDDHLYASLKIAISAELMPYALAAVLDSLNFRYPNLHLELLEDRDYSIEESLESGAVDLFFTFCYGEEYSSDIVIEPIFPVNMYAIFRTDHHLAKRPSVTLKDLDGEQFILYPKTKVPHIRQHQKDLLEGSGIRYSIYDSATPHNLYSYLLPIGKGIILCPWPLHGKLTPNSIAIPLDEPVGKSTYSMLYRRNSSNPILEFIVKEIRDIARDGAENDSNTLKGGRRI